MSHCFCKSETYTLHQRIYAKIIDGQRDRAQYCFLNVWSRNCGFYFGSLWFMLLSLRTLWTTCWCHHRTSATAQAAACVHTCTPLTFNVVKGRRVRKQYHFNDHHVWRADWWRGKKIICCGGINCNNTVLCYGSIINNKWHKNPPVFAPSCSTLRSF